MRSRAQRQSRLQRKTKAQLIDELCRLEDDVAQRGGLSLPGAALDNLEQGISVFDAELRLVGWNRRFLEMFDFPADFGVLHRPFVDFIRHNADHGEYGADQIEEQIRERIERARNPKPHSFQRTRPDGTVVEVVGNPMPGGGFITTYSDITEHQRTAGALLESESRFRESVEGSIAGIVIHRSFVPLFVNREWARIHGFEVEEVMAMPSLLPLIAMPERARLTSFQEARQRGETPPERYEYQAVQKDGSLIWLENLVRLTPWDDQPAIQSTVIDISEHKRATEEARERAQSVDLLQKIAVAANEAPDDEQALQICLDEICAHTGWPIGHVYRFDEQAGDLYPTSIWHLDQPRRFKAFTRVTEATRFASGIGLPGRVFASKQAAWIVDVTRDDNFPRAGLALDIGVRAAFAFPVLVGQGVAAVLEFFSTEAAEPEPRLLEVMNHVGTQLGRVIERQRSAKALRESEERYRLLVEPAPVAIIIAAGEDIVFANQSALGLFGAADSEQLVGRPLSDIIPAENGDMVLDRRQVARAGYTAGLASEITMHRLDGSKIDTEVVGSRLNWQGSDTVHLVVRDISRRKRVEEALRQSEERFRSLFRNAPVGQARGHLDGRLIETNERAAEIYGYPSAEDMIAEYDPAKHWFDLDRRPAFLEELVRIGFVRDQEMEIRRQDGSTAVLSYTAVFYPEHDHYDAVFLDVTERRRAAQALEESEEKFRSLVEGSLQGILVTVDGRVAYANQAAADIFGYALEEIIGLAAGDLTAPSDRERVRSFRARRQQGALPIEGLRRDGATIAVETLITNIIWERQAARLVTLVDVTERKHSEEQLRQAQKMEAVGQLTGGVAHDFNNLLAVVVGYLGLLAHRLPEDSGFQPLIDKTLAATDRGAKLTHRLLAFSRKQALDPKAIDLNQQIQGTIDILQRTVGATIAIETVAAADLWWCKADPNQVANALLNLAINARDAMPDGGNLTIETANVRLDEGEAGPGSEIAPGDYAVLAVSDTGVGMTAEVIEHAFEPFFTTKGVGRGSGLGLSMVFGFAQQSGGLATIHSEEGRGTTVKLYLPRIEQPGREAQIDDTLTALEARGETVLVVEDDEGVRALAVELLENLNYDVREAGDGVTALQVLRGQEIDLLLSDIILPGGITGPQIGEQAGEIRPGIKVLYMSGYTPNTMVDQVQLDGGDRLLQKPFSMRELAQKVREILDRPDTQRDGAAGNADGPEAAET